MKLLKNAVATLPELPKEKLTCLLYVFQGKIRVNGQIDLAKMESLIIKDEQVYMETAEEAELLLFVTDEEGKIFDGGMYSGNQK